MGEGTCVFQYDVNDVVIKAARMIIVRKLVADFRHVND